MLTLEAIRDCPVLQDHVDIGATPKLADRGIPEHNVWKRVAPEDFVTFMDQVKEAATIARDAFDLEDLDKSAKRWHDLFDDPFPYDKVDGGTRITFVPPAAPANPSTKRYG